jgi:hypothetical protein
MGCKIEYDSGNLNTMQENTKIFKNTGTSKNEHLPI